MLASGRSLLTMATLARALVRAAHPQPVAARFASLTAAPVRAAAVQSFRPTTTIPAASIAARHSSGASYDKNAYANMPAEPQYSLPTDAPEDTFELFYFATRGRGEQIRMLLAESGLPYVDRLLSQWQLRKLKAAGSPISNQDFLSAQTNSPLPFGSLPMLRRRKDGLILGQTIAILQYIAEEGGLMPKTAKSKARAMMLIAGGDDLFQNYWPIQLDKNKDYVKAPSTHLKSPFEGYTVPKGFRRETLPRWLTYFEALLRNEGPQAEYFVDNQLSYVDVVLYAHFDACRSIEPDCLKPFPALSAHFARVGAREKLKAYLEKRPESGL